MDLKIDILLQFQVELLSLFEQVFDLAIAPLWLELLVLIEKLLELVEPVLALLLLFHQLLCVFLAVLLDVRVRLVFFDQDVDSLDPYVHLQVVVSFQFPGCGS